jgi:NADH dehydrogenase [ubiquinone] 1 alpha subcomplex assembly factor 1
VKSIILLFLGVTMVNVTSDNSKIDFGSGQNQISNWSVISDNVMGGITKSKLEYTENTMVLSGNISLANYGGFASVKTGFGQYDLSPYKGVKIRFKSTNQKFAFTLEDKKNWTLPNFKGNFYSSKTDTWEETILYFKDFKEYRIGEPTGNKLQDASLQNMVRLGIITTEKKEGPFSIEVDYIEFIK